MSPSMAVGLRMGHATSRFGLIKDPKPETQPRSLASQGLWSGHHQHDHNVRTSAARGPDRASLSLA